AGSTIDASSSLGGRSARGTATHAASGTWTSANGTLVLQPSQADSGGSVEVRAGDGRATRMPIPAQGGGALAQEYRCSGDTLETRIRIPGSNDPIVQRFVRECRRRASPRPAAGGSAGRGPGGQAEERAGGGGGRGRGHRGILAAAAGQVFDDVR